MHDQPGHVLLHVELDLEPVGLLDQGVQQVVAGLVGPVAAAGIAGAAEGPLGDAAVVVAAERAAPMVHLVDHPDGVLGHLHDGVLVAQIVAAFHRVEGVLLPGVVHAARVVGQRRVDAALRGAGVAAGRMDLREDGHVDAGHLGLDGRAQAGQAPAHDDHVMMDHVSLTSPN